jgi:rRNA maturation protein Rpf1
MVLITTSRHPSIESRILSKDLSLILTGSLRINRGKMNYNKLINRTIELGKKILIIIEGGKSKNSSIKFLKFDQRGNTADKLEIRITKFIRKKDIIKQRIPATNQFCILFGEDFPERYKNNLNHLANFFTLDNYHSVQIKKQKAIIFYFDKDNKNPFLTFYVAPEVREIGPRIYFEEIYWNDKNEL